MFFLKQGMTVSILLIAMLMLFGCSGQGNAPLLPESEVALPDKGGEGSYSQSRSLWGIWQFTCDIDNQSVEITRLRGADTHYNVLGLLETPTVNLLNLPNPAVFNYDTQTIDIDVALKHPFAGLDRFTGFDVRGILLSHGTITGFTDPDIKLQGENSFRLINADGYTRWWNAKEFSGNGYLDGRLGSPNQYFHFDSTVNGYKLFTDTLTANSPVTGLNPSTRAVFGSGVENIRHYSIKYQVYGENHPLLVFNYAVDASHEMPDKLLNDPDVIDVPEDFPLTANSVEPWLMSISEIDNTLFYNQYESGGSISIEVEVFDWQSPDSIGDVWCESPGVIPKTLGVLQVIGADSATYLIQATDCTPFTAGPIDILFAAESVDGGGYQGILAGKTLASYNVYEALVLELTANYPPVAAAEIVGGNDTTDIGESLTFDATASSDLDGEIVDYLWDFDGDGIYGEPVDDAYTGNPIVPVHIFPAAGDFPVDLKVVDNDGGTDTIDEKLMVHVLPGPVNNPPVADAVATSNTEIYASMWVSFDASTSFDPDAGDFIATYEWDFDGDGVFGEPIDDVFNGDIITPKHQFTDPGIYDVNLKVYDSFGATDTLDAPITITVNPLFLTLIPDPSATKVELDDPEPYQGERPPDLSVIQKDGSTKTFIVEQGSVGIKDALYAYHDDYTVSDFQYLLGNPPSPGKDWDDINRFSMNRNGSVFGMVSANPDDYSDVGVPMFQFWNLFNGADGYLQNSFYLALPQTFSVDTSDGLRATWLNGNPIYMLQVYDTSGLVPNTTTDQGEFVAARFTGNFEGTGFTVNTMHVPGMMGTGPGKIDYDDPLIMRLGVDDTFYKLNNFVRYYILDSAEEVEVVDITASADPFIQQGTIDDFAGTPVDLECLDASEKYGIEWNWVAVLEDIDGEYIIQVFQFDSQTGDYILITQSESIEGEPLSMDIDDENFEIHALARKGSNIEATKFIFVE